MELELSLLQAAKRMDKDALVKIFDLYASPLYNYALRLCRDPLLADHIVGDVFAKLLEQFSAGKGPTSNLRSYLYETAYHIIIDQSRASQRQAPLDALTLPQTDVRSWRLGFEDRILFDIVLRAIEHELTDDQRHVIILRFLEDFSLRETAAILGKEPGHIKVIQSRAIAKLRKVIEYDKPRTTSSVPGTRRFSRALSV
jgi:RNA polymerase sigma-70 factor (ECF subfamily)